MAIAAMGGNRWRGVLVRTGVYEDSDVKCGAEAVVDRVSDAVAYILRFVAVLLFVMVRAAYERTILTESDIHKTFSPTPPLPLTSFLTVALTLALNPALALAVNPAPTLAILSVEEREQAERMAEGR